MPEQLYALTPRTAARLKRLLGDEGEASPTPRHQPRGRTVALVKCTSATAATTSGLGAQCYPGVVLLPRTDDTTPTELDGEVWLTVWDDSGGAATPTADAVYTCILGGFVDPGTGQERQRAHTTTKGGNPSAAQYSGIGATIAADSTWYDTDTITLPGAGTYLIHTTAYVSAALSGGGSTGTVSSRLYNTTDSVGVLGPYTVVTVASDTTPMKFRYSEMWHITVTKATDLSLQFQRATPTFGSWSAVSATGVTGYWFEVTDDGL